MCDSVFKDKTLMITGGTGSFGNTVLKHFMDTDLAEIRIFSRDEKKQDDMRHRLQAAHGVGRDIEGICLARGDRIVLLLQPLIGILRIGLTAARRHRVGADDQLSPPDNDGDVLQNVPESGRAALDDRQTLGLLIALGDKLRTVRLYDRHILIPVSYTHLTLPTT